MIFIYIIRVESYIRVCTLVAATSWWSWSASLASWFIWLNKRSIVDTFIQSSSLYSLLSWKRSSTPSSRRRKSISFLRPWSHCSIHTNWGSVKCITHFCLSLSQDRLGWTTLWACYKSSEIFTFGEIISCKGDLKNLCSLLWFLQRVTVITNPHFCILQFHFHIHSEFAWLNGDYEKFSLFYYFWV